MPPPTPHWASLVSGLVVGVATTTAWWWWSSHRPTKTSEDESSDNDESALIYLDYNGTTPIYPPVLQAMMPYWQQHYGNPSSAHVAGDVPQQAMDEARRTLLTDLLGCSTDVPLSCLLFTSCGTESDNLAIHLALYKYQQTTQTQTQTTDTLPHVVTCNVEHPAIAGYLQALTEEGKITVTYVPVQPDGRVRASDMINAIQPKQTILVTLMLANNESGALQPVRQVAEHCRQHGILCHTDAAQAAGKVSVRVADDLGDIDMVSLVGHKLGAPKGIACLYVREGCFSDTLHPRGLLIGGAQEFGWRGGTPNVPYMVGMAKAASLAAQQLDKNKSRMERLRHRFMTRLQDGLGQDTVLVHGPLDPEHRLPNTLSIGFAGTSVYSRKLLEALRHQMAASAGATCHNSGAISSVLQAMQIPQEYAQSTIRLSLGPHTTSDQIDRAAVLLIQQVKHLRRQAPDGFVKEL